MIKACECKATNMFYSFVNPPYHHNRQEPAKGKLGHQTCLNKGHEGAWCH